ncbi:MAG: hypothetical protein PHT33_01055 [bacterium]|nr:hypothetical protein [bacterium]
MAGDTVTFEAYCRSPKGMVVKIPVSGEPQRLSIDGKDTTFQTEENFGHKWLYFVCPQGNHKITRRR